MEHLEQPSFLTGVCFKKRYLPSNRQKTIIYDIRRETKLLALRLSSLETLDDILENLNLNYSIVKLGINIDQYENISFDEIKQVFAQLKNIQKQSLKNKNNQKFDNAKKLGQFTLKNIPKQNQKNKNKANHEQCSKTKKTFGQRSQEKLVYEIKKELSARKYLKYLNKQHQNHIQKKNANILSKINHSAEKNKMKSYIHQKAVQAEKQNFQQSFINSSTFMTSYFKNEQNKQPIKKKQKSRFAVHQSMNFDQQSIIYQKTQQKYFKMDRVKTQQNYRIKHLQNDFRKNTKQIKKYRVKLQQNNDKQKSLSNASNSQEKAKKQYLVLQRKSQLDQLDEIVAIKRVIQKNLLISQIKQKKINNSINENSKHKYKNIKMLTEAENQNRYKSQNELQLKIKNNLQQKSLKRQEILTKKSQQAKIRLLYSRQRFMRRKQQIDKQNYDRISEYQQIQTQYKQQRKAKKQIINLKVQRLIKKQRQIGEQRQILSQQIMNIRKSSDQQLQKKISELHKKTNSQLICKSFI